MRGWIETIIPWNASRRRVIVGLVLLLLVVLVIQTIRRPMHIDDPPPPEGPRFRELADRIDPNTADAATLGALPGIGPRRAADIIAFREQHQFRNPDTPAFASLDDLLKIRGIGYAITRQLEPYLIFPRKSEPPLKAPERR
jgi:hypothetical protein